jgi:hypothetical protein
MIGRGMMNIHGMNNNHSVTFPFPMLDSLNILFLVMSLLIFSYLFTRRRLQREQKAARPILERSEGSGMRLARRLTEFF